MPPATNSTLSALDPNESRAWQHTTAIIVCPTIAAVLTALRFYTRLALLKKCFWEDLSIGVALATTLALSAVNQLAVVYGSGRHFETISAADWVEFQKLSVVVPQLYSLVHFFLKLSILLQYVRVSVMQSDRRLCHVLITTLCIGYLIFILLRMVRCIPLESQWTKGIPGAKCYFNSTWFLFASQAWNMLMDFVILLVPLVILRHSTAPPLQRVLFVVVLAFGGSACIISAVRLQTLYPSSTSTDPSWDKVPSAVYALVEVNVGISCASVVTLRPLFHRIRRRFTKVDPPRHDGIIRRHSARRLPSVDLDLITGDATQIESTSGDELELGRPAGGLCNSSASTGNKILVNGDVEGLGPESPGQS